MTQQVEKRWAEVKTTAMAYLPSVSTHFWTWYLEILSHSLGSYGCKYSRPSVIWISLFSENYKCSDNLVDQITEAHALGKTFQAKHSCLCYNYYISTYPNNLSQLGDSEIAPRYSNRAVMYSNSQLQSCIVNHQLMTNRIFSSTTYHLIRHLKASTVESMQSKWAWHTKFDHARWMIKKRPFIHNSFISSEYITKLRRIL